MHSVLASAIETAIMQIAKRNMLPLEYQKAQRTLLATRLVPGENGHRTLHDEIVAHAVSIADWATNNGFSSASDAVDKEVQRAIQFIKSKLGWN